MSWSAGKNLRIYRGGETIDGSYTLIPGVQQVSLRIEQNFFPFHVAGDNGWAQGRTGLAERNVEIQMDGVFTESTVEQALLEDGFAGNIQYYQVTFVEISKTYQGQFAIQSYEREASIEDIIRYRLTLMSAGTLTEVEA